MKRFFYFLLVVVFMTALLGCQSAVDKLEEKAIEAASNSLQEDAQELAAQEDEEEISESSEADEEYDEDEGVSVLNYDNVMVVELPSDYPNGIVPIIEPSKVINATVSPGGSAIVDLILPTGNYEDAVAYYGEVLGLEGKPFKTDVMESMTFVGKVGEYNVTVLVGLLKVNNNDPTVNITMYK